MVEIVIPYCPRDQFVPYHDRTERFAKIVAHRRFGKTVGCINDLIKLALTNTRQYPPPRYAYVAPTYTQAKDIAWGYLKYYSAPLPGLQMSESELWVEYPNGARIRLYGADNYDRVRGLYHDGVVIDEPAQMNPRAWPEVIRPTLSDYKGWATFIGTPQGRDWFYRIDLDESGAPLPDFFRATHKASETGIIGPDELKSLRSGMTEDQYAREFECSFDAAIAGAYYARLLEEARKDRRIGHVAVDPILPVKAFWDIGGAGASADAMSIWIAQFSGQQINVLDYIEGVGQVLAYYVTELRSRGWAGAKCYLPHDGVATNNITGKRYEDHVREAGFDVEVIKNQGKGAAMMRIEAARRLLPRMWFNETTTVAGREALAHYHEKRSDDDRQIGLGPNHDWSSHAADAFGLMCVAHEIPKAKMQIQYSSRGIV